MYTLRTQNINVATAQTDSALVAAGTGAFADKRIGVMGFLLVQGTSAAAISFTTKPAGAGTAISSLLVPAASGNITCFPDCGFPIWVTNAGEGLSLTTGATTSAVTGFVLWAFV